MGMDPAPEQVTLRHSQAVWIPIVVWAVCALAVGDAVIEGTPGYAVRVAVLVAAIAYVVYVTLARPSLEVDGDGVTIVNVMHTNRIPFGALEDVRVGGLASVFARTAGGGTRKITSWNAPGVPRRLPQQGDTNATGESETEQVIRGRWDAWKVAHPDDPGRDVLVRRWNSRELGVAVALIVLNIAIRLR